MPIVAHENEMHMIDFSKVALNIGIQVPGEDRPWMELNGEELKALHLALTKPILDQGSLADNYPMLRMLATWAKAASDAALKLEQEHSPH